MFSSAPATHPRSLWDYRLAHALGRIAARRGDTLEARRQIAAARRILDGDSSMAAHQEQYYPYLVGYVALYTNDLSTAEARLSVQEALNSMEPIDREVLALKHFERLSFGEIAQVLGLTEGAAGSRYLKAIKRLKGILPWDIGSGRS